MPIANRKRKKNNENIVHFFFRIVTKSIVKFFLNKGIFFCLFVNFFSQKFAIFYFIIYLLFKVLLIAFIKFY